MQSRFDWQPFGRNYPLQHCATDLFHHDETYSVVFRDFVNGDNVRVIERRGGLRFLRKLLAVPSITSLPGGEELQRYATLQGKIACLIALPHAAIPDLRQDLVMAKDD